MQIDAASLSMQTRKNNNNNSLYLLDYSLNTDQTLQTRSWKALSLWLFLQIDISIKCLAINNDKIMYNLV